MPLTHSAKSISTSIRAELLRRGWKVSDLARQIGTNPRYVTNVVAGFAGSRRQRLKIEAALGMPFWSTRDEFPASQKAAMPATNSTP